MVIIVALGFETELELRRREESGLAITTQSNYICIAKRDRRISER